MSSGYFISEYEDLQREWQRAVHDSRVYQNNINSNDKEADVFFDKRLLKSDYPFLNSRKIYTRASYDNFSGIYKDIYKEAYLVRIPILGVAFHINDLSLISSLSFIVLLIIFYFFLVSEEDALVQLFYKARKTDENLIDEDRRRRMLYLRHYYKLHSVRQVLTITPDSVIGKQKVVSWLARRFAYLLFMMPAISCFLVLLYDLQTTEFGHGNLESAFAVTATVCVILLNIYCCVVAYKTDASWLVTHELVEKARLYDPDVNPT